MKPELHSTLMAIGRKRKRLVDCLFYVQSRIFSLILRKRKSKYFSHKRLQNWFTDIDPINAQTPLGTDLCFV